MPPRHWTHHVGVQHVGALDLVAQHVARGRIGEARRFEREDVFQVAFELQRLDDPLGHVGVSS